MFRRGERPGRAETAPPDVRPDETAAMAEAPPAPAAVRDDASLVRAARAGDLDAFNLLVLRYERVVFTVCLRLVRDVPTAEDAAQDTFVKAWTNLASFHDGPVRPWLLRIATNRCYDLLRSRRRRPATSLEAEAVEVAPVWSSQAEGSEPPERAALRSELAVALEHALAALPTDQRVVVLLADLQGCDYHEVAAVTGTAIGTVKSRLSRARARLRQHLRDDPATGELFDQYRRIAEERDREARS